MIDYRCSTVSIAAIMIYFESEAETNNCYDSLINEEFKAFILMLKP